MRKAKQCWDSIEIQDLSGDHFEIAFGATMPAAQIAAVEADHDRRGHCVDLGISVLRPDAAAQYARPLGGSDYALCRR